MKKFLLLIGFMIFNSGLLLAQAPDAFNYQAVARDDNGETLSNQEISVRISLLKGTATGSVVYSEDHNVTTDNQGLFSLKIGKGTSVTGSLPGIDWSSGPFFVKVEMDETGGSNYQNMGTSQLLSVPYALYAGKAENSFSGKYDSLTNKPDLKKYLEASMTKGWDKDTTNDFSGVYDSLIHKPDLGKFVDTASVAGWDMDSTDDFKGVYDSLQNKPVFQKNGNIGVNNTNPLADLTLTGSRVLIGADTAGRGKRIFWEPWKAAFLVGNVTNTKWNPDSLGRYSISMGNSALAKNFNSVAIGNSVESSGDYSFTIGSFSEAKGSRSFAIGNQSEAIGRSSFAIGGGVSKGEDSYAIERQDTTYGDLSLAFGSNAVAYSAYEIVLGKYNTAYTPQSDELWKDQDRLFVIGNGSPAEASDAFKIMKNAKVGINVDTVPAEKLHVDGAVKVEKTTTDPKSKTVYGNSTPLAYGFVTPSVGIRNGAYGLESFTKNSTGDYTVTIKNGWQNYPAINVTVNNTGGADYNVTYSFSNPEINVFITDNNGTSIDRGFSIVVYGMPK
jgi:hypothetical protein